MLLFLITAPKSEQLNLITEERVSEFYYFVQQPWVAMLHIVIISVVLLMNIFLRITK
jgi:hypothetical protein